MLEILNLNYYYGNEVDQYSFYCIFKILLIDCCYKGVLLEVKVLYGLLFDCMGLLVWNGWLDNNGWVFFYFMQEEVMIMLGCGKDKVIKLFCELEGIGLMEWKKQGQGYFVWIYVKNFILELEFIVLVQIVENQQLRLFFSVVVKIVEKLQFVLWKISG